MNTLRLNVWHYWIIASSFSLFIWFLSYISIHNQSNNKTNENNKIFLSEDSPSSFKFKGHEFLGNKYWCVEIINK